MSYKLYGDEAGRVDVQAFAYHEDHGGCISRISCAAKRFLVSTGY